jgi:hypothetical protein
MRSWSAAPSVEVDVHVARGRDLGVYDDGPVGVQWFPGHRCLRRATLNAARRRSTAPYIATLRLLGAQWNRLEQLGPNLGKHCAQLRLFWAAGVTV